MAGGSTIFLPSTEAGQAPSPGHLVITNNMVKDANGVCTGAVESSYGYSDTDFQHMVSITVDSATCAAHPVWSWVNAQATVPIYGSHNTFLQLTPVANGCGGTYSISSVSFVTVTASYAFWNGNVDSRPQVNSYPYDTHPYGNGILQIHDQWSSPNGGIGGIIEVNPGHSATYASSGAIGCYTFADLGGDSGYVTSHADLTQGLVDVVAGATLDFVIHPPVG